jgi:hypothetical protein
MEKLSVIRMKRERDGAALGDFVVCGENGSLMGKMQAVGIGEEPIRRVFRHVASCSESEALVLLSRPDLLEQKRLEVKQMRKRNPVDRNRSDQSERVKAQRLRVLEEKRTEGGARLLEVDLGAVGGKRARDEEEEEDQDPILCNGQPLKRTNLSLAAEPMFDIFVEETQADEFVDAAMPEIVLDRFYEDEEEEFRQMNYGDDEDPDGQEVDYPDSSRSENSSDRDEFMWAGSRDEEDEEELDVYGGFTDSDRMRHYDCSPYVQEEEEEYE